MDMLRKGREVRGSRCWAAKLTEADVIAIRKAPGLLREIGAQYGVGRQIVGQIKSGRAWRHVRSD